MSSGREFLQAEAEIFATSVCKDLKNFCLDIFATTVFRQTLQHVHSITEQGIRAVKLLQRTSKGFKFFVLIKDDFTPFSWVGLKQFLTFECLFIRVRYNYVYCFKACVRGAKEVQYFQSFYKSQFCFSCR